MLTEEEQLLKIKENPWNIEKIINPSNKVIIEAIKLNPSIIYSIKNQTEEMQLLAVKLDKICILYCKDPSNKVVELYRTKAFLNKIK